MREIRSLDVPRDVVGYPHLVSVDLPIGHLLVLVFEGWAPCEELEEEHPETPDIYVRTVLAALEHLGREVVQSTTEGLPPGRGGMH